MWNRFLFLVYYELFHVTYIVTTMSTEHVTMVLSLPINVSLRNLNRTYSHLRGSRITKHNYIN